MNYYKVLTIFILTFTIGYLNGQTNCELERKIQATNPVAGELNGSVNGVDISGNYAISGAVGNSTNGALSGAAHMYRKEGSEWIETQTLIPTDNSENDRFGISVAIWGDYAIVGAPFDDINGSFSGSVYVYKRFGQYWIQTQKLSPEDGLTSDRFGWDVDIWENHMVVSSLNDYTENQKYTGSSYFFTLIDDSWVEVNKVFPEDGGNFDEFGASILLRDNLAIVGAPKHDALGEDSGAAYIYENQDTAWVFKEKVMASDGSAFAQFGYSASISTGLATVGAYQEIINDDPLGSVYAFRNTDNSWVEEQKIGPPELANEMNFGISNISIGNKLYIGASRADSDGVANSGAAFEYAYNGSVWEFQRKIHADDAQNLDFYGVSIAMEGEYIIVGAFGEDSGAGDAGAVYVHYLACAPNCTTISSPPDGAVSVPLDATVVWFPVDGATGYNLSVGSSPGANDVLENMDMGLNTEWIPSNNFSNNADYYVNITPYNDAGVAIGCIESSFTTSFVPMEMQVGSSVEVPCYEPIPNEDYIVNFVCGDVMVEVETTIVEGDCPNHYTINRVYSADDGCSTDTGSQSIEVVDDEGPVFTMIPENVIIECDADLPTDMPTAIDQCDDIAPVVTFEDSALPLCGQVIVRTFYATDICGNVSTATQLITIEANTNLPSCSFLESPLGNQVPVDVNLVWTEAANATGYFLTVSSDGIAIVDNEDVGNTLTYALSGLEVATSYEVTIIPYNVIGSAESCGEFVFGTEGLPTCVDLILPNNDNGLVFPYGIDYEWTAADNAEGYYLSLGTSEGAVDILDHLDVGNVLTYYHDQLIDPLMTIYVTITAYNALGEAVGCQGFTFETDVYDGIEEYASSSALQLYPNPSNGKFLNITIDKGYQNDITKLVVYSGLGQEVLMVRNLNVSNGEMQIEFKNNLAPGLYFIILSGTDMPLRQVFVVKR